MTFVDYVRAEKHTLIFLPYSFAIVFLVLERQKNKTTSSKLFAPMPNIALTTAPCTPLQHVEKSKVRQTFCA